MVKNKIILSLFFLGLIVLIMGATSCKNSDDTSSQTSDSSVTEAGTVTDSNAVVDSNDSGGADNKKPDPPSVAEIIFSVMGGLGIFLLGMKNMSEGMQAVAGDKIRTLINKVTNNRFVACGVGTSVTMLIQSSSVTTVLTVGMVNAGLMTLTQAIGVILGANIGTTITGWILVLKVSKYGLPLLGIAAFFYLFSKRDKVRYLAGFFLGLGMVFFGLELMKNGFAPLRHMPQFEAWFARYQIQNPSDYFGVLRCCLIGAVLTAIVQSSSATLGITIGLAMTGVINFYTAAALVLGENIGTTITALLASLGASTNAKRAAYAHTIINVLGVIWITSIFALYMKGIEWFVGDVHRQTFDTNGEKIYPNAAEAIAATHTGFNVINAMFFLPLVSLLAKLLCKIVPDKKHPEIPHLTFLDVRMFDTPAIGIEQSQKEIQRMSEKTLAMFKPLRKILETQQSDKEIEKMIFQSERDLDIVQKEIVEFLSNIMAGNIAHDVIDQGRRQLRISDELESISDYITSILKLNLKLRNTEQVMSDQGRKDIVDLHDIVAEYLEMINQAIQQENRNILKTAGPRGQAITHTVKEYRNKHIARVGTGTTTPLKSLIYTDMLTAYRRIRDHALNIAEVLAGEK
ncbi:MAG: Na/Pi cotransporter family protein [Sedimentisphaerales bacterium]|nr:Na/Pi cotransporter family protein [Sedimentisphaerales bacterium]